MKESSYCNNNGVNVCGACVCKNGFQGRNCECRLDSSSSSNSNSYVSNRLCNGKGIGSCGRCYCYTHFEMIAAPIYTGEKCECSDSLCPKVGQDICGGPTRGRCDCNKCVCNSDYTGENCGQNSCTNADTRNKCVSDGKVCSNNGNCVCGKCVCNSGYEGDKCQDCKMCQRSCQSLEKCARCSDSSPDKFAECVRNANCPYELRIVSEINDSNVAYCHYFNETNCQIHHGLDERADPPKLLVLKVPNPVCYSPVYQHVAAATSAIVLVSIIMGCLFAVGSFYIYRRMEYLRFRKELNSQTLKMDNPLYTKAVSTFKNPFAHSPL